MSWVRKGSVRLLVVLIAVAVTLAFMPAAGGTAFAAVKRPAKVKHVRVVKKTKHSVMLRWKKAKRAKKYRVYKYSAKKHKFVKVKTVKKRTVKIKGLKAGKAYKFKVRGIRGKKKGKPSKAICVRTKGKAKSKYCTVTFVYKKQVDCSEAEEKTVKKKVRRGGSVKAPDCDRLIRNTEWSNGQSQYYMYEFKKWSSSTKNIRRSKVIRAVYDKMTNDEYEVKHPEERIEIDPIEEPRSLEEMQDEWNFDWADQTREIAR